MTIEIYIATRGKEESEAAKGKFPETVHLSTIFYFASHKRNLIGMMT